MQSYSPHRLTRKKVNEKCDIEMKGENLSLGFLTEQPSANITSLRINYGNPTSVKVEYEISTGSPTRLDLMFT